MIQGTAVAERYEDGGAEEPITWNLSDLYAAPDDPQIARDLEWAGEAAKAFQAEFAGKLAELSGERLAEAIAGYEAILERIYRLLSYAQLRFSANMAEPDRGRFLQDMQERCNDISTATLFFCLELNKVDEATIAVQLASPAAQRWAPWVRDSRMYAPHQLDDEMERMLHDKSVTGAGAWRRLFDQTLSDLRFDVDGERLSLADTLNRFDNPDAAVRRTAAQGLGAGLGDRIGVFSLIANTLAKDKEIEDRWRHYPNPVSFRNLSNKVEDEVVQALVSAVSSAYGSLAHRYYALKASWLGQTHLDYWDRNAPLPGDDNRHYKWGEARDMVLGAFGDFEPKMAEVAQRFFDHGWIDAAPRPGKDSGAFCHPVIPSVHPYVLMSFYGRPRDVMTLAHELGHGVHQVLAGVHGTFLADTPLTLAECASVFGEMLVFQALLAQQDDPQRRRRLLASKVESMLNTVVRQIAFHEFEERLHGERRSGELSADRLGAIWIEVQRKSLGPIFRFDDDYSNYWAYISHFIHSPFYVYAYAFGDCLVNSLYQVYSEGHPRFQQKYLAMLTAGGTLRHRELLQPFGLDAGDPAFWQRGLSVISGFIDDLEKLGAPSAS